MKYKFQHFVDISTSAESMQIINFNVGGLDVVARCAHLFNAYKYFKLGNVSVKFVPASTLPVDPLGMGYGDSDPLTVDPRDQLNPGLVRITNGEDLMTDMTDVSDLQQEQMYRSMMLDPRWYKFSLQSGFKRSAKPLYWQVGQLHQDAYPGSTVNAPWLTNNRNVRTIASRPVFSAAYTDNETGLPFKYFTDDSAETGLFQTGHRGRLGFLPTDAYQTIYGVGSEGFTGPKAMINNVPSIRTITCVLPKAYKTIYYYRVYITETVYFSGLRSIAPGTNSGSSPLVMNNNPYRGIDNFFETPSIIAGAPNHNNATAGILYPNAPTNNGEGSSDDY